MKTVNETVKNEKKETYAGLEMEKILFSETDIVAESDTNVDWGAWQW